MLTGVGELGTWALEFLARAPSVDRIVTVKRSPWSGPSRASLAMIGAVFQGYAKRFEHYQVDLSNSGEMARVLATVRPDVILHSATVQSPRRLMNAAVDPGIRMTLRAATFGMWLPWHLLPAVDLMAAIDAAGIETHVVNASFPDVVNHVLWRHFGHGPTAGAGNVEICAAQTIRYLVDVVKADPSEIHVKLVGSHALLAYGPGAGVPYRLDVHVGGRDISDSVDLGTMLDWPEPISWGKVDVFSLFGASAVKNVVALAGDVPVRTHVSGPMGMPGGYPARIGAGHVDLDLPDGMTPEEAISLNSAAARWDGIDRVDSDGTVTFTGESRAAMGELGYSGEALEIGELRLRSSQLLDLYDQLTRQEKHNA